MALHLEKIAGHVIHHLTCVCSVLALLLPHASAQGSGDAEPVIDQSSNDAWIFRLVTREEVRFREASSPRTETIASESGSLEPEPHPSESDHDLRFFLASNLLDPHDHLAMELSMALWADVDGTIPSGDSSAFGSIYDRPSPHIWFDVYSLNADYHSNGFLGLVRGGRQTTEHGLPGTFDGLAVDLRLLSPTLSFFAFGGRSVHFFETDTDVLEDWIASTGFLVRPHRTLKIEVDYRFLSEDTSVANGITDHTYGATLWYRPGGWLILKGYARGIDDELSHTGFGMRLDWTELELAANAALKVQLVSLRQHAESLDPFYAVLGESKPHVRGRVDIEKSFVTAGGTYRVLVGWRGRMLLEGDASRFNREIDTVAVMLQATDIGIDGPFATVVIEYHTARSNADSSQEDLFTVGGALGWESDLVMGEVGTAFHRFKYDYFRDIEEKSDVRTVYAQVECHPLDWLGLRLRYEYEQFDRDIHHVTVTLTQKY